MPKIRAIRIGGLNLNKTLYAADKPEDCRQCYFWKGSRKGCSLGMENCYYLVSEPPKKNQNVMTARMVAIIRALDGVRKRFFARIMAKKQIRSVRKMQCKEMTCGERKNSAVSVNIISQHGSIAFVTSQPVHTGSETALFGRNR